MQQTVKSQGVLPAKQEPIKEVSIDQVKKWEKGNDIWATAVLMPKESPTSVAPLGPIQQLITEYQDIFQEPKTLPPHRTFDHAIHLIPDAQPVNSRPYRYSPLQKDEIERQVEEMLKAGLITCIPCSIGEKEGWFIEILH